MILAARTSKEKGVKGISAFILEHPTPGFTVSKDEHKLGVRGSQTVELSCAMSAFRPTRSSARWTADSRSSSTPWTAGGSAIGALAVGLAQGAYEMSVAYAKDAAAVRAADRRVPGALLDPLGHGDADRGGAAAGLRRGPPPRRRPAVSRRKRPWPSSSPRRWPCGSRPRRSRCTAATATAASTRWSGYFRDAKLMEIGEGTSEIQRTVIAREILKGLEVMVLAAAVGMRSRRGRRMMRRCRNDA